MKNLKSLRPQRSKSQLNLIKNGKIPQIPTISSPVSIKIDKTRN